MMKSLYRTGMEVLLDRMADRLTGRRVGLVTHAASVNSGGLHSVALLHLHSAIRVQALFSPEHGFDGKGGAGELIRDSMHREWDVPIRSLYGETRKLTPAMLDDIDALVFDLQDLGVRCYTYVSTLRYVMETAGEQQVPLFVADRPTPLSGITDGPLLDERFESFVGMIPAPLVYGMTPGETASWMNRKLNLGVDLEIAPMQGYQRGDGASPWIAPSPAIRSPACALFYPAAVFTEALPQFECGRKTDSAFQVLTGAGIDGPGLSRRLLDQNLPGVTIEALENGVRFQLNDIASFRPVELSVILIRALQDLLGTDRVWNAPGVRPGFFDQLYGTDSVRKMLMAGEPARRIIESWQAGLASFRDERKRFLMY